MNSTHAYSYKDDPVERAAIAKWMRERGLTYPRPREEVIPPSANVIQLDNPTKRPPLGLAPVIDDDDKEDNDPLKGFSWSFRNDAHGARPEDALRSDWLFHYLDVIGGCLIEVLNEGDHDVEKRVKAKFDTIEAARRIEVAALRATVVELRGEIREMKAIQEAARAQSRGEQGLSGPRGIPGAQGPAGPRGEQGERGECAPLIAAWEPSTAADRYLLTPVYSTGERGVPANLTGLFEAYHAATSPDDEE
jgi:hypothetical protein